MNGVAHAERNENAPLIDRLLASYWEESYPRAVRCMMRDIEELLNHYCFADPTWVAPGGTDDECNRAPIPGGAA
jgi:hypothetical protein